MNLLFGVFSILAVGIKAIKDAVTPSIPAENWEKKDLYYDDMAKGVPYDQLIRNLRNGRYKLTPAEKQEKEERERKEAELQQKKRLEDQMRREAELQQKMKAEQELAERQRKLLEDQERREQELAEQKKKAAQELAERQRKLLEDQERREQELQQKRKIEQDLTEARKLTINECSRILTNANYINIAFSLKHRSLIYSDPHGYNYGLISAQKDDEKYSVGFEVISYANLPENFGSILLKTLASIMANIDLSDLDNRDSLIKQALMSEKLIVLNENFTIRNDSLCIYCTISNLVLELQFYASKTRLQKALLNFDSMNGHEFEHFCATLLKNNGYERIHVTQGSNDQGIDIIAYKDGIKYGIQCKCYSADIGNKAVQEVFAGKSFYECHIGAVLTNQYFTKSAIELAKKNGIILWDRKKLMELIDRAKSN